MSLDLDLPAEQAAWAEALRLLAGGNAADEFQKYRDDPVGFGRDILGATYWPAQVAILNALATKRRVTIRGPRRSSKTHTAAHAVLWFMSTAPSRVITIGASWNQIEKQLWARIGAEKAKARMELPGVCHTVQWRVAPDWYALGMATDKPVNVRGFHSDIDPAKLIEEEVEKAKDAGPLNRLLLILDEMNGIEAPVIDALRGSMQGRDVYVVYQANPLMSADDPHPYAKSHQPGSGFHRIHISAEKITDDEVGSEELFDEVPKVLVTPEWIEEMRRDYGEKSPIYLSDVRGQFSSAATDWQIIPRYLLEANADLDLPDDGRPESRSIGVDVARAGKDSNVAVLWIGGAIASVKRWKTKNDPASLMTTAGIVTSLIKGWGPAGKPIPAGNVHVDDTGVGGGVVDRLRQCGYYVDAVDFGSGPKYHHRRITGQVQFQNYKAELFWTLRREMEEREVSIPKKYAEVWQELQWHTYDLSPSRGGTMIGMRDDKEKIVKKYGKSPDFADAAVIGRAIGGSRPPSFRVL
jgi:hypothetical protein